MLSYATEKELDHATGVDTSDLAAKKNYFLDNKLAKVDKLDINKLVYNPTSLNNLKAKVDDLDVGEVKHCSYRLEINKWCSEKWSCEKHKSQHTENESK